MHAPAPAITEAKPHLPSRKRGERLKVFLRKMKRFAGFHLPITANKSNGLVGRKRKEKVALQKLKRKLVIREAKRLKGSRLTARECAIELRFAGVGK
ncbi:MAG: hypothetical protein AB7U82_27900 [Blastocatellales bacterium]